MCGIAGYIGKTRIDRGRIENTLDLMRNRGPDNRAFVSIGEENISVVLLHSRLSIIDLEARSNQPLTIGDYTIIFNGEIYNYVELREQLRKAGVSFRTESDTEVLLQYYIRYGDECVNYFEGMWSFAIYDRHTARLFLSRDRFAEKPLYYYSTPDGTFFASEVKFIQSLMGERLAVNYQQILRYLVNGYKSLYKTEDTFFTGLKELPYACNLVIDHDLNTSISQYWIPSWTPREMSLTEAIEEFRQCLLNSIKIRLRADVPLAFCLSGGIDSASIVSIAAKVFNYDVATFSIIDPDERYNELDNIRATIDDLDCRHTLIELQPGQPFQRLKDLIQYHDAPVYTISYYVHSFLSEAISNNGYRIACSGTGADELVTGYYDHFNLYLYEMRQSPDYARYLEDWRQNAGRFVRNPYLKKPELYFNQPDFRDHIYLENDIFAAMLRVDFREDFTEIRYADSLLRNRMMNELFHEGTRVILHEDDLNSMFYSIENRSPYLDSKLYEISYSIPNEYLIQDGYGKYILREAVKGILNEKVRTDRRKVGFNASFNSLVDLDKKESRDFMLEDSEIFEIVDRDKITPLLSMNPMSDSVNKFMFYFLNAKIFLELNG
ncbi:MAG: asparagine synthase (glutamine-hydrolyzing) [Chloroflexi bacterium]|nr:asparagine synthase (glutamine-hydrolyzing) [Chloroflexota bacterium]